MGFPEGWENQAIWQPDYQRDADLVEQANLLRGTPLLYAADAGPLLPARSEDKFTGGRSSLNYYRKNGALLSVPGVKAHRYPAFQFNRVAGDLFPAVIEANRILLNGSQGTEEERWSALKWWNTAVENELKGKSPQQALIQGELTPEIVRSILR